VKALSIRQPWADLILAGRKKYELRSRRTRFRGRILIHASSRIAQGDVIRANLDRVLLLTGAIIGSVIITGCIPFTPEIAAELYAVNCYHDKWQPGLFAWVLHAPMRFKEALPWPGRLGFFEVPQSALNQTD